MHGFALLPAGVRVRVEGCGAFPHRLIRVRTTRP
jgi:hypothetical protein